MACETTYYPGTSQTVSVSGTSAAMTNAVGSYINKVRLRSTTDCFVKISKAPTATTSDMFLPAAETEYFDIHPGEKVAVIQSSASGTLYVTEMTK